MIEFSHTDSCAGVTLADCENVYVFSETVS